MRWLPGRLWGLLIALTLLPRSVEAQSASFFDEVGRFYVQTVGPEDYGSHAQNWAVVQSANSAGRCFRRLRGSWPDATKGSSTSMTKS